MWISGRWEKKHGLVLEVGGSLLFGSGGMGWRRDEDMASGLFTKRAQ